MNVCILDTSETTGWRVGTLLRRWPHVQHKQDTLPCDVLVIDLGRWRTFDVKYTPRLQVSLQKGFPRVAASAKVAMMAAGCLCLRSQ